MGKDILNKDIFEIIDEVLDYIVNIKVVDLPYNIAMVGAVLCASYCISMFVIGFPCSLWETITLQKLDDKKKNKVIRTVATLLAIVMLIMLICEKT